MIFVSICVGSSCHLKGSEQLVELFQSKIKEEKLEDSVVLSGAFCLGRCNREGVTISIGDGVKDEIFIGVTPGGFPGFWNDTVIPRIKESEA